MSDDVIFKQEVRDATFKCVADALEAMWGERPTSLVAGARRNGAICAIANTFATLMPHPVLVHTDSLLIASQTNADSLVAVWHTKHSLLDDESPEASHQGVWDTFGEVDVYQVSLPQCMQDFIKYFDEGLYPDLVDVSIQAHQEASPHHSGAGGDGGTGGAPMLTGGSSSEGGGINPEHGGSEASLIMVGGSESGGGA